MVILNEDLVLKNLEDLEKNHSGEFIEATNLKEIVAANNNLFSVLHLNIRSARKNFDELIATIETYSFKHFDIIILSECFQLDSINYFQFPGYTAFYNEANYNKNDGVLVLIKSKINAIFTKVKLIRCGVTLAILNFKINDTFFKIIAVYRPNPTSENDFIDEIDSYLEETEDTGNHIQIIVGDINIDILDKSAYVVNKYLSILGKHGFQPYIQIPTRVNKESSSCLDHIFVRKKQSIKNNKFSSYVLNCNITDHYPVTLNLIDTINGEADVTNNSLEITKIDLNKLKKLAENQNWAEIINCSDPQIATDKFTDIFSNLIEQSKSISKKKPKNKKIKPWITEGLVSSIKKRDKLKKKLLEHRSDTLEAEYKNYRNHLNILLRKSKNNYYKEQVLENKKNIKNIYKIISEATNENTVKNTKIRLVDSKGIAFPDTKQMANHSNDYFANVGSNMLEQIIEPENFKFTLGNSLQSMYLTPVTENEIIKHIHSLKNRSAPGIDRVTTEIIKLVHNQILKPLVHIINIIFKTGQVPHQFKISVVTPVYKSGNKTLISNYRPISLINNFAKVFEKCLKERLANFLKTNGVLHKNQYGFIEGMGTADAMHEVIKEITNNLDKNKKCIGVFLDLAKAFDTVNHEKLLDVLSHYGVRGTVSNVFRSYLTNRVQHVRIMDNLSDPIIIKMGVPQGTVLGPILFIIYINSLLGLKLSAKIVSYADDTVALFNGNTWEHTKENVIEGMEIIKKWLDKYQLSLNTEKTKYVAFSVNNHNRPEYNSIEINNLPHKIKEIGEIKYLGIIIDKHLKWTQHINYVTNRVRKLVYKFYQLKDILSKNILIMVYKAIVESLFRYGILVWGGLYTTSLKKLKVIQNSILKIMYNKKRHYPTKLLYKNNEILNVRSLYILNACIYIYKKDELKVHIDNQYKTRSVKEQHIQVPHSKKNINQRFITYLGPKFYNLLPMNVRLAKTVKGFAKLCKEYINANYHKFVRYLEA